MKQLLFLFLVLISRPAYAQNFYGGFESWRNVSVITAPSTVLQSPAHWFTADSIVFFAKGIYPAANFSRQVYKTTDAHTGSFAAKMITQYEDSFGLLPALLTNARIELDLSSFDPGNPDASINLADGTNVSTRIPAMRTWVKYFPKGNDTAGIYVLAMKHGIGAGGTDSVIGGGEMLIGNTVNTYTEVSIPVTYFNTMAPDFLQVIITSSSRTNPQDSSTLYIDDIEVETTAITTPATGSYKIYPNPATHVLHIDGDVYKIAMVNAIGQQVYTAMHPHTIDISTLAPGVYCLQIQDKNGIIINVEKLIKQ